MLDPSSEKARASGLSTFPEGWDRGRLKSFAPINTASPRTTQMPIMATTSRRIKAWRGTGDGESTLYLSTSAPRLEGSSCFAGIFIVESIAKLALALFSI
jgi:hypothetical protein